jgi:hypothetical protein
MESDISLSFELLVLLNWIMQNERPILNNMIKHALKDGLEDEFEKLANAESVEVNEQFYTTVLGFLLSMEDCLIEHLSQIKINKNVKKDISPLLKRLELMGIRIKPVFSASKLQKSPDDAKNVLFQQILKNWKPDKNDLLN